MYQICLALQLSFLPMYTERKLFICMMDARHTRARMRAQANTHTLAHSFRHASTIPVLVCEFGLLPALEWQLQVQHQALRDAGSKYLGAHACVHVSYMLARAGGTCRKILCPALCDLGLSVCFCVSLLLHASD